MNSLFLNTIEYLSSNKPLGLDKKNLLYLLLEINKLNLKDEVIDKNKIFEYFFTKINFVKLFENCLFDKQNNKEITLDELNELNQIISMINELVIKTGDKEEINEKIDLFIMLYIIYTNLFFNFLFDNKGKNYDKIKTHLLKYRNLFKNFNAEIMFKILMSGLRSSHNFDSIILVMKDFIPDMLEGLKLFSNYEFFMTFNERLVYYNKNLLINILDLFQQKNTDEVKEFL